MEHSLGAKIGHGYRHEVVVIFFLCTGGTKHSFETC